MTNLVGVLIVDDEVELVDEVLRDDRRGERRWEAAIDFKRAG